MREGTHTIYEDVEIVCPKNKKHRLTSILTENYCEAGPCLRLICKDCANEKYQYEVVMDFGLRGEPEDWSDTVKKWLEINKNLQSQI